MPSTDRRTDGLRGGAWGEGERPANIARVSLTKGWLVRRSANERHATFGLQEGPIAAAVYQLRTQARSCNLQLHVRLQD